MQPINQPTNQPIGLPSQLVQRGGECFKSIISSSYFSKWLFLLSSAGVDLTSVLRLLALSLCGASHPSPEVSDFKCLLSAESESLESYLSFSVVFLLMAHLPGLHFSNLLSSSLSHRYSDPSSIHPGDPLCLSSSLSPPHLYPFILLLLVHLPCSNSAFKPAP